MKKTKKIALTVLALVVTLSMVLTGCGKKTTEVDAAGLSKSLTDGLVFQDEMLEIGGSVLANFYPTIDQSTLISFWVYKSSSGATAEEIAVFVAKDAKSVKTLEEAVTMRIEDLTLQFEDYIPAEMKKIGDAVRGTYGNVVVLVIADDSAAAQKILDEQF